MRLPWSRVVRPCLNHVPTPLTATGLDIDVGHPAACIAVRIYNRGSHASAPHFSANRQPLWRRLEEISRSIWTGMVEFAPIEGSASTCAENALFAHTGNPIAVAELCPVNDCLWHWQLNNLFRG